MIILGMFCCVMLVAGVYYALLSGILWLFLSSFVFEFRFAACAVQFRSVSWLILPGCFFVTCLAFASSFLLYTLLLTVVTRSYHVEEYCPRPAGSSERRCDAVRYVH